MLRVVVRVQYLLDDLPLLLDVSVHHRAALMTEILKIHRGLCTSHADIGEMHFDLELWGETMILRDRVRVH